MLVAATMLIVPALAAAFEGNIPTPTPLNTPVNTAAPMLSGNPAPGQTLTCSTGTWSGNPISFSYAWLRDGLVIAGQTVSTYVVQAADQGHSISCQVTASNTGGEYSILGLPSGSYKVEFRALESNYLFQYFSGKSTESTANTVAVTAPNVAGGVNAESHVGGQISGKVSSVETHVGIAKVYVCAEAKISPTESAGNCAVTSSSGEYTIVALPTGSYTVNFQGVEGHYTSETYEVNPVSVTVGSTTPYVDAALATGGHISGRVTAESGGGAIAGAEVCTLERTAYLFGCGIADSNGEYTIEGLPSGTYEMFFEGSSCNESGCTRLNYINQRAPGVVVTVGSTTKEVNATLATGGQISGTVSGPDGGSGVRVCAGAECASTNANGEYTIIALSTGKYTVEFTPAYSCGTSGCMATNYLSQTYSKSPVSVTAGTTTAGVDTTMSVAGKISGRITAESGGIGVAGEACANDPTSHFYGGCAYANSNGEYAIEGLPSGAYEMSFHGYKCIETTCVQLNYLGKKTTGISVTAGSTTEKNVALATGGQITGSITDAATHAALANEQACAFAKIGEAGKEEYVRSCASTNGGASGVAHSSALTVPRSEITAIGTPQVPGSKIAAISTPQVPGSKITLIGTPQFNAKTGDLVFTFSFPTAGKLSWSLFVKNVDLGYADSLGISINDDGTVAETAKHKKSKRCNRGHKKHKGKCVRVLVPFASGSENVSAGTFKVRVHPSGEALEALKQGHTLHVSGTFTFQSSLGGQPAHVSITTVVHSSKKKGKKRGGKHNRRLPANR